MPAEPQRDLFGQEILEREPLPPGVKPKRHTVPRGYAAAPGTGPKGETCKTCAHCARLGYHNKRYRKCAKVRARWTHGAGTDILARTPACAYWERAQK